MIDYRFTFFVLIILIIGSCTNPKQTANTNIQSDSLFIQTKELAKNIDSDLFAIFDQSLSAKEEKYLKFLYSYMPLSDLADYNGEFYLHHVRSSIMAQQNIQWANTIPEDIYKHFILPYRVNNENLDTARIVFYNTLKDRIKGLSMYDAAIEVNHWCHQKVEYHSADGRTSSPLATLKTAFGRCGEQSTFAVAAMRAVCIPARQVYTPRWAHSDDNHAWVEVWADGQWYFLGACEPEPVLNYGWFAESATRTMLVHARVYGKYNGIEEVNVSTSQYDDINVVDRYAYTFKQYIKVVDADGKPVENATVEYQLYNYAEFYPITKKQTDNQGISFLTTGFGELLIWARNDDNYGFVKLKIAEYDTAIITMNNPKFENVHWELMPPDVSGKNKIVLTDLQMNDNKKLLQQEDSIRNAYVSSFISKEEFVKKHDARYWKYIKQSRGNYKEIIDFIDANKDGIWIEAMLEQIAAKDLRDTKASILNDHLNATFPFEGRYSEDVFKKYILNPRVELEMLLPYRAFFKNNIASQLRESIIDNPGNLKLWIDDNINIENQRQAYNLPLSPVGVYNLRVSDYRSLKVFFVAVCRSFGIPARLEPGTTTTQYLQNGEWNDVYFKANTKEYKKVNVEFNVVDKSLKFTPQYYHHITLARFENNRFNTLEFGEYQNISEIGKFKVRPGKYQLITSNRLASGKILVDLQFIDIDQDMVLDLEFPTQQKQKEIIGSLSRAKLAKLVFGDGSKAIALQQDKDIVVAIIQPDKEPSKHILNDLQLVKSDFDKLNNSIIFLIPEKDMSAAFKQSDYPNLPIRTIFKTLKGDIMHLLEIKIDSKQATYPKVMIAKPNGDIYYLQQGYKIGVSNDLLKLL